MFKSFMIVVARNKYMVVDHLYGIRVTQLRNASEIMPEPENAPLHIMPERSAWCCLATHRKQYSSIRFLLKITYSLHIMLFAFRVHSLLSFISNFRCYWSDIYIK
jgi:hypothetical protein